MLVFTASSFGSSVLEISQCKSLVVPLCHGAGLYTQLATMYVPPQALQFPDTQLSPQSLDPCQVSLLLPSAQQVSFVMSAIRYHVQSLFL